MTNFISSHRENIHGALSCFDRMLFRGYLPLYYGRQMAWILHEHKLLNRDFKNFVTRCSAQIKEHALKLAAKTNRPVQYLNGGNLRKDDEALKIAQRDGIKEGLVCIFRRVESNRTFRLRYGKGKPFIDPHFGKCEAIYFYFMDPRMGLIHVRLSTWFPLDIQIYLNGHEWLANELTRGGISFTKVENAFLHVSNWELAQRISDRFTKVNWVHFLERYAKLVNPLLGKTLGERKYYWTTNQAEYSTDIIFKSAPELNSLYRQLLEHGIKNFGAEDIMTFLGRKLTGHFQADVGSELKSLEKMRLPGIRIKHQMKGNRIKMYNKSGLVLRIETVINRPQEFKIRRKVERAGRHVTAWVGMTKGVAYLWRYKQVAEKANHRYLDALSTVKDSQPVIGKIDTIIKPKKTTTGRTIKPFNPIAKQETLLFHAVLRGENYISGFRNKDLRSQLCGTLIPSELSPQSQSGQMSRLLARMHGYGLVAKIPHSRKWRATTDGQKIMSASIRLRETDLPKMLQTA